MIKAMLRTKDNDMFTIEFESALAVRNWIDQLTSGTGWILSGLTPLQFMPRERLGYVTLSVNGIELENQCDKELNRLRDARSARIGG